MPSLSAHGLSIFEKYLNAHLKFTVYGHKQASKHIRTLTHFRNAVPPVWGSLRLAPISTSVNLIKVSSHTKMHACIYLYALLTHVF